MMQILMLVILLCGCGSKPDTDDFDLDGTFRVDSRLDPNGPFAKAEPQKILAYYLRKLGATVVDPVYGATNDTIFVAEGFDCPAGRVGYRFSKRSVRIQARIDYIPSRMVVIGGKLEEMSES